MELLRFFTAGNVDDGKSTLIGRLLYDSQSISTDIIETLTKQSKAIKEDNTFNLALLTDGLRAEREQGITIDVAYKYFTTSKRKFIIADTPGHVQYTRNMFTGASLAHVALLLIDARHGITEQTKRHAVISSILRIPNVLVCINKMDLINYSEHKFNEIKDEFMKFAHQLNLSSITFIPMSALLGENVVTQSNKMDWYREKSLLDYLETVEINSSQKTLSSRFQVQYVIRQETDVVHNYRGYAGKVLSGKYYVGQKVKILPGNYESEISCIEMNQQKVIEASSNSSIIIQLKNDIDVGRGCSIIPFNEFPFTSNEFTAILCWMDNCSFVKGQKFYLQQNSFRTKAIIKEIVFKINIHSFEPKECESDIQLNDICKVVIKTAEPMCFDSFKENTTTGAFILINEATNNTIAAGVIE
ncbi:MAG: 50S ribosome-binding GTPase [Bacteroidia bacterium]|nr:50S ribosome-binding GTPase [Bacteroidia bacterium]